MIISHVGLINPVTRNHNNINNLIVTSRINGKPPVVIKAKPNDAVAEVLFSILGPTNNSLLSLAANGNLTMASGTQTFNSLTAVTITSSGNTTAAGQVSAGSASFLSLAGRSRIYSSADGLLRFVNDAQADFTRLQLGGTTSSFPALGRSATFLSVLLADGTTGGGLQLSEGASIDVGTTIGSKIGNTPSQKLGFWNATPIVQPSGANQAAITDSTTGTPGFTLSDVGLAFSQATINSNFASLARQCNEFRNVLVNTGLMKGAA